MIIIVSTSGPLLLLIVIHRSVVSLIIHSSSSSSTGRTSVVSLSRMRVVITTRTTSRRLMRWPHLIMSLIVRSRRVYLFPGRSAVQLMLLLRLPLLILAFLPVTFLSLATSIPSLIHIRRIITPGSSHSIVTPGSPRPSVRQPITERCATLLVGRWHGHCDIILIVVIRVLLLYTTVIRVIISTALLLLFPVRVSCRRRRGCLPLLLLLGQWHRLILRVLFNVACGRGKVFPGR